MKTSAYQIIDEPRPGTLSQYAVNPVWPFLAVMFGGTWLSWPWFALNAIAVGSPTRRREIAIVIGGFVSSAVLLLILLVLFGSESIPIAWLPYGMLGLLVFKLGVTYWLHVLQAASFEIYEYYGGAVRQGLMVLVIAYFIRRWMTGQISESNYFLVYWLS